MDEDISNESVSDQSFGNNLSSSSSCGTSFEDQHSHISFKNHSKREQVRRACVPCARAKRKCSGERPCQRCVDLNMSDKCIDVVTKSEKKRRAREARLKKRGPNTKKPRTDTITMPSISEKQGNNSGNRTTSRKRLRSKPEDSTKSDLKPNTLTSQSSAPLHSQPHEPNTSSVSTALIGPSQDTTNTLVDAHTSAPNSIQTVYNSATALLDRCVRTTLACTPVPVFRTEYSIRTGAPKTLFFNQATLSLLNLDSIKLKHILDTKRELRLLHPSDVEGRVLCTLQAVKQHASNYAFRSRLLRSIDPSNEYSSTNHTNPEMDTFTSTSQPRRLSEHFQTIEMTELNEIRVDQERSTVSRTVYGMEPKMVSETLTLPSDLVIMSPVARKLATRVPVEALRRIEYDNPHVLRPSRKASQANDTITRSNRTSVSQTMQSGYLRKIYADDGTYMMEVSSAHIEVHILDPKLADRLVPVDRIAALLRPRVLGDQMARVNVHDITAIEAPNAMHHHYPTYQAINDNSSFQNVPHALVAPTLDRKTQSYYSSQRLHPQTTPPSMPVGNTSMIDNVKKPISQDVMHSRSGQFTKDNQHLIQAPPPPLQAPQQPVGPTYSVDNTSSAPSSYFRYSEIAPSTLPVADVRTMQTQNVFSNGLNSTKSEITTGVSEKKPYFTSHASLKMSVEPSERNLYVNQRPNLYENSNSSIERPIHAAQIPPPSMIESSCTNSMHTVQAPGPELYAKPTPQLYAKSIPVTQQQGGSGKLLQVPQTMSPHVSSSDTTVNTAQNTNHILERGLPSSLPINLTSVFDTSIDDFLGNCYNSPLGEIAHNDTNEYSFEWGESQTMLDSPLFSIDSDTFPSPPVGP